MHKGLVWAAAKFKSFFPVSLLLLIAVVFLLAPQLVWSHVGIWILPAMFVALSIFSLIRVMRESKAIRILRTELLPLVNEEESKVVQKALNEYTQTRRDWVFVAVGGVLVAAAMTFVFLGSH